MIWPATVSSLDGFDDQDILACTVMNQRLSQDVSLSMISPSVYYLGIL